MIHLESVLSRDGTYTRQTVEVYGPCFREGDEFRSDLIEIEPSRWNKSANNSQEEPGISILCVSKESPKTRQ